MHDAQLEVAGVGVQPHWLDEGPEHEFPVLGAHVYIIVYGEDSPDVLVLDVLLLQLNQLEIVFIQLPDLKQPILPTETDYPLRVQGEVQEGDLLVMCLVVGIYLVLSLARLSRGQVHYQLVVELLLLLVLLLLGLFLYRFRKDSDPLLQQDLDASEP